MDRLASLLGMLLTGLVAVPLLAGCGQKVQPGQTHHRLYSWSCPRAPGGKAFLVLRYQGQWIDASKTTRVGLIKFRTDPPPTLIDDQYVWGVPTGDEQFVLFDATRNRILRRTPYVRQLQVGAGVHETGLLAFADEDGAVEVVWPDGGVAVPAEAGYTGVMLAFERLDGSAVLALARGDGRWELRDTAGQVIEGGPSLTTLELGFMLP